MARRNNNGKPRKNGRGKPSNGNRAQTNMPKRMAPLQENGAFARSSRNTCSTLSGRDFVTRVSVKGTDELNAPADRILLRQPISATSFAGTRVSALSQLWERYRWHKAIMEYVPAVPNTLGCQLLAYIDTDPLDDPSTVLDVDDIIRQATAQQGSRQWNFNSSTNIPLVVRKDDQLYYTGVDKQNLRFSLQGVLYILQVTGFVDFNGAQPSTGIECGSLYLNWECMFSVPQINPGFVYPPPEQAGFEDVGEYQVPSTVTGLVPGKEYFVTLSNYSYTDSYPPPTVPPGETVEKKYTITLLAQGDSSQIPVDTITTAVEFVDEGGTGVATTINASTEQSGNSGPFVKANNVGEISFSVSGDGPNSLLARLFTASL